jgi:hypothetical protein
MADVFITEKEVRSGCLGVFQPYFIRYLSKCVDKIITLSRLGLTYQWYMLYLICNLSANNYLQYDKTTFNRRSLH